MSSKLKNLRSLESQKPPGKNGKMTADAWQNVLTGLGVIGKDKNTSSTISWQRTDRQTAEALFSGDDLGGKIAKIIPFDGTREGVTWNVPEDEKNPDSANDTIKFLDAEFERLQVWENFNWAWTMARVFGGACVFVSVDDGQELEQPLVPTRIRKVNALHVLDRWQLTVTSADIFSDLKDPLFGTPEFYRFTSDNGLAIDAQQVKIHHSRLIRFDGEKLSTRLYVRNNYWHDSVYGKLFNAIRNYSTSQDGMATIITEANQPVYKIDGLTEAVSQDQDELVVSKLQLVNLMRSSLRAIVLDKEDEFNFLNTATAGIDKIATLIKERLIAASGIPHTRLMGESPGASLGEAGKNQMTEYYDMVKATQEIEIRQPLNELKDMIFGQTEAKQSEPEGLSFTFDPLYQQDQKTLIETRKIQADIDQIYMDKGVYDAFEVADNRFGTGEYSYETTLDDTDRKELKEVTDPDEMDPEPDPVVEDE